MSVKVGINGFGRIGKLAFQAALKNDNVVVNQFDTAVPTKISTWTKIKNFLFQEITVELTPKQEATFKAINDFWHQEITGEQVRNFLFQKIQF